MDWKRRALSAVMAVVLAFGLTPMPAFATGDSDLVAVDSIGGVQDDGRAQAQSAQDNAKGVSEGTADSVQLNGGVDSNQDETVQAGLSSIEFVYIESPVVGKTAAENIVVGFVDDGLLVEEAELAIVDANGEKRMVKQSESVNGAVLFSFAVSDFELGSYSIEELRYKSAHAGAELTSVVSFAGDDVVDYSFRVVDGVTGAASESDESVEVFTITPDGDYVCTSDISSAMAAAGVDPENGPNSASMSDGLTTQASDGFVIVLDPGHGGYDSGATGNGLLEKDVNLKIAQYCKAKLEETPGVTVYMTRTDDTYVALSDRTAFAVAHGADLVVSLHNNAGGGRGSEVIVPLDGWWYYDETYVTGTELGYKILEKLNALGLGTHSGVYSRENTVNETYPDGTPSDYYALIDGPRWNGILGIIVEHAFIDDAGDATYLNNDADLQRLGEADAQAIIEYYNSSDGLARLYWGVYDYDYYLAHYPEVATLCGGGKIQTLSYFKTTGMAAGHRANVLFDVVFYRDNNPDLNNAFGDDLARYYQHFLEYGMDEGRQGSADFSPAYYRAAYSDLQRAFGSDWKQYYKHYVTYGMNEGRVAVGEIPEPTAPTSQSLLRLYQPETGEHHYTLDAHERDVCVSRWGWVYEGIAWICPSISSTPVYRLYHPESGLHHYTTSAYERDVCRSRWGWSYEGIAWYSDDAQGVPLYRLYHPETGQHHYTKDAHERDVCVSKWGWVYEGIAWYGLSGSGNVELGDEPIMGASSTSVDQMVRRYNAVGKTYPSGTYSKYGASTIEQFCQILFEEATAEGVRPEVVFAQSMHETGWLQYGGDVSADQCNFAGIGATGGVPGNSFNTYGTDSVRMGLRAQVQHLKAYASTDGLNNPTIDPRFTLVTRGCAPTVIGLSGRWATGSSYGEALISQMQALFAA